jgi:kynureninase
MNQLTVNLHLLLISFYRPSGKRIKILFETKPFPSDHYAFESQARLHGLDPKEVLVEMQPREGEITLRTEDIVAKINELGDELAVVCFGAVNYFTGQFFDT